MTISLIKRFAACSLLLSVMAVAPGCSSSDDVLSVRQDDPDFAAAITKARASLPHFWQVLAQPSRGEHGFALKIRFAAGAGAEHLWTTDVKRDGHLILVTMNNEAQLVRSVGFGDRVSVQEADISDWEYLREGKVVGNFTLQAGFKLMPAEEAARYRERMAEP